MSLQNLFTEFNKTGIQFHLASEELEIDYPEGALTSEIIASIRENKQAIIEWLRAGENNVVSLLTPLPKAEHKTYYSLSSAQKRLYFVQQLNPSSTSYNMPLIMTLDASIDISKMESVFIQLLRRYESFRTSFIKFNGEPVQNIREDIEFKLDLLYCNANAVNDTIRKYIRPFNLESDLLLRAAIIHTNDHACVLVVDMHHLACDGITCTIIENDFLSLLAGETLPPVSYQYRDFSEWESKMIGSTAFEQQESFWMNRLAGEIPVLDLYTDYRRPKVFTFNGDVHEFIIDAKDARALNLLSARFGVTLYMNMLALLNALFFKYTGQEDIIIGTATAGRHHPDLEKIAGMFVNTLAMRNFPSGEKRYSDFLDQVKENSLLAFENQHVQFEAIIEKLHIKRDPSRNNPLFDVNMVVQNFDELSDRHHAIGNFNIGEDQRVYRHVASKLDLNFLVEQCNEEIYITIEYYSDLFTNATIVRLEQHLRSLLKTILNNPEIQLKDIDLLGEAERQQILSEFNETKQRPVPTPLVLDMFRDQVKIRPDSPALQMNNVTLTYSDLNERANQLCAYLLKLGVKKEDRIALLLDRGPKMVIAMLAIWKAQASFLPIDPAYPEDRVSFIIKDASVTAVVTTSQFIKNIQCGDNIHQVMIDCCEEILQNESNRDPDLPVTGDLLCYVIYTSGTTGRPKGVLVDHSSFGNLLSWHQKFFELHHQSRTTSLAGIGFDASLWELWPYLACGAQVFLYRKEEILVPENLIQFFAIQKISHAFLPTSLVPEFVKNTAKKHLYLKYLLTGGDTLPAIQIEDLGFTLVNNYGPTEGTVVSTAHKIGKTTKPLRQHIGKPIENVSAYVVDSNMRLLPIGVSGELLIGGVQISRGYLNLPTLTSARFVDDMYSEGSKGKLYRTGDRARWMADGNIEYLGREDDQVKLRGFRIELSEIESVLLESGLVKNCCVASHTDSAGEKSIIAYVTAKDVVKREEITNWLRTKLPDYMIPAHVMLLESLPLNLNGKVDKKMLPHLIASREKQQAIKPVSDQEILIRNIWASVLDIDAASIDTTASFFDIGGHSLLAISVLSRIKNETGVEISIVDFFTVPTVAGLAEKLFSLEKTDVVPAITAVIPRPERVPLSFSQERLWFLDRLQGTVDYHMPAVLKLSGKLDAQALDYAFNCIVGRHEILRTVYREEAGEVFQTVLPRERWHLEIVENFNGDSHELLEYIKSYVAIPFDLSADPVLRVRLVRLSPIENILIVVIHHIASDGWSQSLLVNEFIEFYTSRIENRQANISDLQLQYADYAIWQRKYLNDDILARKLDYWNNKLSGCAELNLPTDHQRPAVIDTRGDSIYFTIPHNVLRDAKMLSHHEGVTLFMTLLASFKVLLARYSGQEDICIGTPVANRTQNEIEPLMGFFLNTLALRSDLSSNISFREFLQQVKRTVVDAFENQNVPFDRVVERVQPVRQVDRNPLFQVMFNLLNQPSKDLYIPGVKMQWIDEVEKESKFDITLYMIEVDGGLACTLDYATSLFKRERMVQLSIDYTEILKAVIADPTTPVMSVNFLSEKEKQEHHSKMNSFFE